MSSAIALAAAAAFNLVCTAVPQGGPAGAKPVVETFRVDLERVARQPCVVWELPMVVEFSSRVTSAGGPGSQPKFSPECSEMVEFSASPPDAADAQHESMR